MPNEVERGAFSIGDWVRRFRAGSQYHFTDSTVADGVFTRCGRRLDGTDALGRPLAIFVAGVGNPTIPPRVPSPPWDHRACVVCAGSIERGTDG